MMTPASFVLTRARKVRVSWAEGDGEREWVGEAEKKIRGVYLEKGSNNTVFVSGGIGRHGEREGEEEEGGKKKK